MSCQTVIKSEALCTAFSKVSVVITISVLQLKGHHFKKSSDLLSKNIDVSKVFGYGELYDEQGEILFENQFLR
ncbi:MAG: hypothetical protein ABI297_01135 [Ginsengibacter sp.]